MGNVRKVFFDSIQASHHIFSTFLREEEGGTTVIYRIESGVFGGPYNNDSPSDDWFDSTTVDVQDILLRARDAAIETVSVPLGRPHGGSYEFQVTMADKHNTSEYDWFSCFTTKTQLVTWFKLKTKKYATALAAAGFGIAMYEVPSEFVALHPDKEQAIFVKGKATLLRRLPITKDVVELL